MEHLLQLADSLGGQSGRRRRSPSSDEEIGTPPRKKRRDPPAQQPTPQAAPAAPVVDIATLVAALREAVPPPQPPQPQPELAQCLMALSQTISVLSESKQLADRLKRPQRAEKRARSASSSLSPSSYHPSDKRSRPRAQSKSPSRRSRSDHSSAVLSRGQRSVQSERRVVERLDPLRVPPVKARSALDHKLSGSASSIPMAPTPSTAAVGTPVAPRTSSSGVLPTPMSTYSRPGPPQDGSVHQKIPPHPDLTRSWRESWVAPDFRFSQPLEFVPVIQALAKIHNFDVPEPTAPPIEDSEFSVFATSAPRRSVVTRVPWTMDPMARAASNIDDRRIVKEASSFGDSTLAKFFPLCEEDEALVKVLEIDQEVTDYIRATHQPNWDTDKPFGSKPPRPTKEAERFARQTESTASLLVRLTIYLQRTQGFISGALLAREKERAAMLAGVAPPPMADYLVDGTLAGAISLSNYLAAAITRLSIRMKMEAGFDRRLRFLAVALAEQKRVVPTAAKLRLKELPLTKGSLFAGQWTSTLESASRAQMLSITEAQLAREQPSSSRSSEGRFRIPFKKGKGSGGQASKRKKGGGRNQSSSSAECGGGASRSTGTGHCRGRGGGGMNKNRRIHHI